MNEQLKKILCEEPFRLFRIIDVSQLPPAVLRHNSGAVAGLIKVIPEQKEWALLPILADAVEDAGCNDATLLAHLRWPRAPGEQIWLVAKPQPRTAAGWIKAFNKGIDEDGEYPVSVEGNAELMNDLLNRVSRFSPPKSSQLVMLTGSHLEVPDNVDFDTACELRVKFALDRAPAKLAPLFRLLWTDQYAHEESCLWAAHLERMAGVPVAFHLGCYATLDPGELWIEAARADYELLWSQEHQYVFQQPLE